MKHANGIFFKFYFAIFLLVVVRAEKVGGKSETKSVKNKKERIRTSLYLVIVNGENPNFFLLLIYTDRIFHLRNIVVVSVYNRYCIK
jgi:hypothetical protein